MPVHRKAAFAAIALDAHPGNPTASPRGVTAAMVALDAYMRETMPRDGRFANLVDKDRQSRQGRKPRIADEAPTCLGDLLSDLMHHCDAQGIDFDAQLTRGDPPTAWPVDDPADRVAALLAGLRLVATRIGTSFDALLERAREHHDHEAREAELAACRP